MKLKKQTNYRIRYDIEILIDKNNTNLPIIFNVACNRQEVKEYGHHFKSALRTNERFLGFTGRWNVGIDDFDYEFGTYAQMLCPCVGTEENENLTRAQKELLLWHWR